MRRIDYGTAQRCARDVKRRSSNSDARRKAMPRGGP